MVIRPFFCFHFCFRPSPPGYRRPGSPCLSSRRPKLSRLGLRRVALASRASLVAPELDAIALGIPDIEPGRPPGLAANLRGFHPLSQEVLTAGDEIGDEKRQRDALALGRLDGAVRGVGQTQMSLGIDPEL